VKVRPDGRHVIIDFTGFCGAPKGTYQAVARESATRVTLAVYGARPYSNLCAGPQHADVVLQQALGNRQLTDAYNGRVHQPQTG